MPDIYEIVNATQLNNNLEDIADAIRAKSQGQDPLLFPSEFISEIGSIPTGASITGATDVTVKALQPITNGDTCYIFKNTYSKYLRPLSFYLTSYNGVAWSPDGTRLAGTFANSPRIAIWDTTPANGKFTRLTAPDTLPAGAAQKAAFSPDGTRLAVAHSTTPFITIYDTTTTPYTKIADPATLPAGTGHQCAFSPDGGYLAVTHVFSPRITIYKTDTTPYTKISNPGTLPGGTTGAGLAWSPDGTRLAVGSSSSDYITTYDTTSVPFTKLSKPDQPPSTPNGISWSPDGTRLAVAHNTTPFITIYDTTTSPYTKITLNTTPDNTGRDCKYSPNGQFLAIGTDTVSGMPSIFANQLFIYLIVGPTPMALPAENIAREGNQDINYGYAKATIAKGSTGTAAVLFEP